MTTPVDDIRPQIDLSLIYQIMGQQQAEIVALRQMVAERNQQIARIHEQKQTRRRLWPILGGRPA